MLFRAPAPQAGVSTNSTTRALNKYRIRETGPGILDPEQSSESCIEGIANIPAHLSLVKNSINP
jgi:hypothetical protein